MRLMALGLAAIAVVAGTYGAEAQSTSREKQIAAIFDGLATDQTPGLAVLVKQNGRVVFERGYGAKELRTGSRIDTKTNFRLASVTKQFTAMAVMLLVHDKKLTYETTLGQVFPEFPEYGKQITIRQLLSHTGGLPDYEDLMEAAENPRNVQLWSPEKQIQDAEVLSLLEKETKGKFVPGTKWNYSNSGYVVLGVIVAKVSGKPFGEFLHERIFAPLKMSGTIVFQKGKNEISNRAYGHSKNGEAFKETDQSSTSATQGDGGVYSSVEDLSKWDNGLRNHTLLSEEEMKPALVPAQFGGTENAVLPEDAPTALHGVAVKYGFGWFLDPYRGHERIWHYGDTMGFKTAIQRFTKGRLTVIVLCNRSDLDPGTLATKVADLYLSKN